MKKTNEQQKTDMSLSPPESLGRRSVIDSSELYGPPVPVFMLALARMRMYSHLDKVFKDRPSRANMSQIGLANRIGCSQG